MSINICLVFEWFERVDWSDRKSRNAASLHRGQQSLLFAGGSCVHKFNGLASEEGTIYRAPTQKHICPTRDSIRISAEKDDVIQKRSRESKIARPGLDAEWIVFGQVQLGA